MPGVPSIASRDVKVAAALMAAGTILQLPALLWGVSGGKSITNALRILAGDVPYRDFWTMYAPGHFYLIAGLFKVFGVHVWVQGAAAQVMWASAGALLFLLTRRLGLTRPLALAAGGALVLMQWGHDGISSYEPALLLLLFGLDRVVRYVQGAGAAHLVVAGVSFGAASWFKHDIAFHVTAGAIAGMGASALMVSDRRPSRWISPAGVVLRVGGAALITALPVAILMWWAAAGPDAWRDLIVFPATDFRVVRGESYPGPLPDWGLLVAWARDPLAAGRLLDMAGHLSNWAQANAPQVVFLAALFVLVRHHRTVPADVIAVSAVALATMPLFWASAHVQQNTHLMSLWIWSIVLGALALGSAATMPRARRAIVVLLACATCAFLFQPARRIAEIAYYWSGHATLEFPAVSGVRVPRWRYEIYQPITAFIRRNVPASEPIYVGLARHDAVVISNQAFYVLAGRPVASRYNELHPGVVDREEAQREIIADLERLGVRCAVLWHFGWPKPVMDDILEQRRRRIPEIGATVLDDYFRREFEEVARYGEYVIVWRKGRPRVEGQ